MKRPLLSLAALSAVILAAGFSAAHAASAPAPAPAKQQKLYKVLEIKGAQKVQEFEHDVKVMQTERQQLLELQTALEKEKNAQAKKDLKAKYDAALKKFTTDNEIMEKGYHFSMARDYTLQIDAVSVYLNVTDEEAAKIDQQLKAAEQAKAKK